MRRARCASFFSTRLRREQPNSQPVLLHMRGGGFMMPDPMLMPRLHGIAVLSTCSSKKTWSTRAGSSTPESQPSS